MSSRQGAVPCLGQIIDCMYMVSGVVAKPAKDVLDVLETTKMALPGNFDGKGVHMQWGVALRAVTPGCRPSESLQRQARAAGLGSESDRRHGACRRTWVAGRATAWPPACLSRCCAGPPSGTPSSAQWSTTTSCSATGYLLNALSQLRPHARVPGPPDMTHACQERVLNVRSWCHSVTNV